MILDPFIQPYPHGKNKGTPKELPHIRATNGASYNELLVIPTLTPKRPEKRQQGRRFKEKRDPSFTLTGQDIHGVLLHNIYGGFGEGLRVFKEYSPTIRTPKGGGHIPLVALRHVRTDQGKEARRESREEGTDNTPYGNKFRQFVPSKESVTGTVTTGINKDALIGHNTRIRRLTPTECERLQGFPDGWTEWGIDENGDEVKISDTQRYKTLGNAVTVNVIEFLGHNLRESINSKNIKRLKNDSP